ncbi:pseudouridine synthase [Kordiimonas sp.]|uniref:pseudouridine synthase n=1 Tax=Kordiimonas sp. TaxID=1970157 RepID=UPI003A9123FD
MSDELEKKGERIAKALARAGVGSRRDVERMIAEGRVSLDGKKLETPAVLVESLKGIMVDGEAIGDVADTKLWRMNKRRGTLTTHKDPEGRRTVFDQLPGHVGRVIAVGRLDMNTEGLLLLTNDGELARYLELPANELIRRYRVRVYGRVNEDELKKLADGVTIDGTHYGAIDAKLEREQLSNAWLTVAIREGKNREVRRVMEHLGLVVNRLIRTHYGPFTLGSLNDGAVAQVPEKQLYDVLGDFFTDVTQSVAAPEKKRDPSKWAKAKPPKKVRLGAKRKPRNRDDEDNRRANAKPGEKPLRRGGRKSESRLRAERAGTDARTARAGERPKTEKQRPNEGRPASSRPASRPPGANRPAGQGRPQKRGPKK